MQELPTWLNQLIEAQNLCSTELSNDNLTEFVASVSQWQQAIQLGLPKETNDESERRAIEQLRVYSEQLIEKLSQFRSRLQTEQQQLIKQNTARSAYNKAR
jgi:hypothetical protein